VAIFSLSITHFVRKLENFDMKRNKTTDPYPPTKKLHKILKEHEMPFECQQEFCIMLNTETLSESSENFRSTYI